VFYRALFCHASHEAQDSIEPLPVDSRIAVEFEGFAKALFVPSFFPHLILDLIDEEEGPHIWPLKHS
jgi:hypothetical protein